MYVYFKNMDFQEMLLRHELLLVTDQLSEIVLVTKLDVRNLFPGHGCQNELQPKYMYALDIVYPKFATNLFKSVVLIVDVKIKVLWCFLYQKTAVHVCQGKETVVYFFNILF